MTCRRALAALALAPLAALPLALAGCSSSTSPVAAASTQAPVAAATSPSPIASCSLPDTHDMIERTVWPGVPTEAQPVGEVDLMNCVTTLSEFQQTAGQGTGECTTIAWASGNPGYDVNAVPAPPLKDVLESAGPGC